MTLVEKVRERVARVKDPELHRPIAELGMLGDIRVVDGLATVGVKLTVQGCPLQDRIESDVKAALADLPEVRDVHIDMTVMTKEERQNLTQRFRPIRESSVTKKDSQVRVIIVGSGKGGVGKSTLAVNLAAALHDMGRAVGVLDADVYGFSVPRMIGVTKAPVVLSEDMILPVDVHGVKVISMGMLVGEDTPVMWRGPMLTKLIEQFMGDVVWGSIDYLIVDAPPGTGDVAITLAQRLHQGRVLLVTTPQAAAAKVAVRVAEMSRKVGQTLVGVVENMAYFRCPHCGEPTAIFGEGGGSELAQRLGVPLLGKVPLGAEIREGSDVGQPIVWADPQAEASAVFRQVATALDSDALWPHPLAAPVSDGL